MNAVIRRELHHQVIEDASYANGESHLEADEVPQWVAEAGMSMTHTLAEALSDNDDDKRDAQLCELLTLLCRAGDDIAQRKAVELQDLLRALLTDHCRGQAQRYVDRELT